VDLAAARTQAAAAGASLAAVPSIQKRKISQAGSQHLFPKTPTARQGSRSSTVAVSLASRASMSSRLNRMNVFSSLFAEQGPVGVPTGNQLKLRVGVIASSRSATAGAGRSPELAKVAHVHSAVKPVLPPRPSGLRALPA